MGEGKMQGYYLEDNIIQMHIISCDVIRVLQQFLALQLYFRLSGMSKLIHMDNSFLIFRLNG